MKSYILRVKVRLFITVQIITMFISIYGITKANIFNVVFTPKEKC